MPDPNRELRDLLDRISEGLKPYERAEMKVRRGARYEDIITTLHRLAKHRPFRVQSLALARRFENLTQRVH